MFGKFDDKVAKNAETVSDYAISMKKHKFTDREQNRIVMVRDFETGTPLPAILC